ncbi:MAG: TonB-dependent receptor plug domain-containing protein [Saprospiraceae bacterium]|nr:TonB-dependent receptor plug domain-containing protein [Saprospiraceae bacterium]
MNVRYLWTICVLLTVNIIYAQNTSDIKSQLIDQTGTPIIAAWVDVNHSNMKIQTDEDGYFTLKTDSWPAHLDIDLGEGEIVHVEVENAEKAKVITANKVVKLDEFVIKEKVSRELNTLQTRNVETITKKEFQKAACCRLSESFDNTGSVSVSETDAVTGAKEMEILGLRGIYSLITLDNTPDFTGINYPFALDMIPGTWLNEVAISKGISNAINGSNGFSGQVNIGLKNPFEDQPIFVNMYGNTMGRYEANVHLNKVLPNPVFATGLYLHASKNFNKIDDNHDNFMDTPLSSQLNALYKFRIDGLGPWESGLSVQFVKDERTSGQVVVNSENPYTAKSDAQRFTINGNTGFVGFNKEGRSIGFKYQYTNNQLGAAYGRLNYTGNQNRGYFQALYEDRFNDAKHILYAGASLLTENLKQKIAGADFNRNELVPAIYAEYAYNPEVKEADKSFGNRLGLVATVRADFHNIYGTQIAPALTAKYNITMDMVLRANVGKGYRTPYFFTDNISSFVNGRPIEVSEKLNAEEAINYGLSYTLKSKIAGRNFTLNADLYQTQFQNQIIVDQESYAGLVKVSNLEGESVTTSALLSTTYDVIENLSVKLAYKWNHIEYDQAGQRIEKMLAPKDRALLALHYTTPDKKWEFSNTTSWIGQQDYLERQLIGETVTQVRKTSDSFVTTNAQVTKKWDKFDIYIGGENLTNYTQENPVQHGATPQSDLFDVSQVYAPLIGIRGYIGFRWNIM